MLVANIATRGELCWTLARKDFFVRYRRAVFGVLWAIALPAIQAIVLAVVLTRLARLSVPHYAAFIYSGTIAWTYFSAVLTTGSRSIVENSDLSSRVYFPRAILPLATAISNLFTLIISSAIAIAVAWIYGIPPGLHTLVLIPATISLLVFTTSLTLVAAATQVYFRDTAYFVQAAVLVWFYLTPIFYPLSKLHSHIVYNIVAINPVTGLVDLFHTSLVNYGGVTSALVATSVWTVLLLWFATVLYSRFDRNFADLL